MGRPQSLLFRRELGWTARSDYLQGPPYTERQEDLPVEESEAGGEACLGARILPGESRYQGAGQEMGVSWVCLTPPSCRCSGTDTPSPKSPGMAPTSARPDLHPRLSQAGGGSSHALPSGSNPVPSLSVSSQLQKSQR